MGDIEVIRFEKDHKYRWDQFIAKSKNGTFLFYRDYMEYHSDILIDFSLMFFRDNRLIALMPSNIKKYILYSHGGLTYGGIISDYKMRTPLMLEIFEILIDFLRNQGIKKIVYKAIPYIYHKIPSEEDLYALFLHDAKLIRRDASSAICMNEKMANRINRLDLCKIIDLPKISDVKGNLTFIEGKRHIPFEIKRVYYLYDVPGGESRGGHAHKSLQQFIIAASGSFDVILSDGKNKTTFHLNRSYYGLYLCPMVWREIENFSSGSVCVVLASDVYKEDDYIRDFNEFKTIVKKNM